MSIPRRNRYTPIKARVKYRLRRDLVHAAGCVVSGCLHRDQEVVDDFLVDALVLGVRIPRSLRARAEKLYPLEARRKAGTYQELYEDMARRAFLDRETDGDL